MLSVGDVFTVTAIRGVWVQLTHPILHTHGWVSDMSEHLHLSLTRNDLLCCLLQGVLTQHVCVCACV